MKIWIYSVIFKKIMYNIYTDGSYKSSINRGGYASIILNNDMVESILHFGYTNTTNNRMELMGVLSALKYFPNPTDMTIYSDSAYIINNLKNGFVKNWIESNDSEKKNMDIWREIVKLYEFHNVNLVWVKGHNNNKYNELADLYANISAVVLNPEKDEI